MRLAEDIRHILVGGAVIAFIAIYMTYGYLTDRPGQAVEGYPLTAKYRAIDGIEVGSDVLLAGIPVGKVVAEEFDTETNNAILTFHIRDDVQIPYDSVAMIVSDGVFGGKYVKIAPGGDFENLQPGEQFEYVQDSVMFEELLEKVILAAEQRKLAEDEAEAGETAGDAQ